MKIALFAAVLALAPVTAHAQTAPQPSSEVQTTAPTPIEVAGPTPTLGLSPAQIVDWLKTQGVAPGAVQQDGDNSYVRVTDGPLTWILFFQSCADAVCTDLQFSVGVQGPAVTMDTINGWNRDRRFLKAFYDAPEAPGGPASAVVQYDLFLRSDAGPQQLTDHLAVWRGLAPEFVRLLVRPAPAAAAN